ncbi:MAG: methyltransferase domain-containing protein [Planktothrix agardhii]|uniref:class I SAM-dependent methyltransferase n=1 Tax=Planktothrix agardhii TaxID=1160 RepID=UPI003C55CC53
MLRFVSKEEYWKIDDSGILASLSNKMQWHLKSIQDAVAFEYLYHLSDQTIAEVGGGNSRILPVLSKNNICYNIDEFKGVGAGPQQEIVLEGVKNVLTFLGTFSPVLPNNYFDYVFSVSVVEHVPTKKLDDFFKDVHRILKPNGTMIHLIDVYLEDSLIINQNSLGERLEKYRSAFFEGLFLSPDPNSIISKQDLEFSTQFATNPDNIMNSWNQSAPGLKDKRIKSQGCSLIMVGVKQ